MMRSSTMLILFFIQLGALAMASDDEYLRSLQDPYLGGGAFDDTNNDTCSPNTNRTGFVCQNISVDNMVLLGNPLFAWLDLNSTFEFPNSDLFLYQGQVFLTYYNLTNDKLMDFEFNSTTPNDTVLSAGDTDVGRFNLPTGNAFFPFISTGIVLSHNLTLLKDVECSSDASNFSFCDNGTLHAIFGIHGEGTQLIENSVQVTVRIDEPEALVVTIPFQDTVDRENYCQTLNQTARFKPILAAKIQVCIPGFPCYMDQRDINTQGFDTNATLENNQCFRHSLILPPR